MKIALSVAASQHANHHAQPSAASSTAGSVSTSTSGPAKRGRKKPAPGGIRKSASALSASDSIQTIDRDKVLINGIEIDIEKITDEQLYSLRKILPRKDYR
jgi:hypothetical protein